MGTEQELWVDICGIDDVPVRGSRIVKTGAGCIAVFRTIDNEVYALDDQCPHKNGPLSQGIVHGKSVTCPLHNWVISLETGAAIGEDGGVKTRKTSVRDGRIHLQIEGDGK